MAISYLIGEAFRSLFRSKRLNLIALGAMSMALMALGLVLILNLGIFGLAHFVEEKVEVVAFLEDGLSPAQVEEFIRKIRTHPQVRDVHYISPAEAWQEFSRDPYVQNFLDALGGNPLPASIQIQLQDKNAENIHNFVLWLQQLSGVQEASYGGGDTERLLKALQFIRLAVGTLTAGLLLAALIIIANIINLMVLSRQKEIGIMRMIGASSGFIRGPFLIWGLMQGITGGVVASGLLVALWMLLNYFARTELGLDMQAMLPPDSPTLAALGGAGLAGVGGMLGLIGSLISVGREMTE